ncbi:sortase [Candidatus Dojkabacteria bacterium]|uniref:Sortase n=1 Tax=Candidatus Dojkabacteria bacterium TaxID=2099670 RepID=A0A955ICF7_9BACT|nr:sortase [Candidatus Dojkabacteria bacterium]
MSLYEYRKAENYKRKNNDTIELGNDDVISKRANAIDTAKGGYNFLHQVVNSSTLANLVIPSFFIALGIYFIFQYYYPQIQQRLQVSNELVSQGTTTLISDNYIDRSQYISNPAGLAEVTAQAFEQHILQDDQMSKNYKGTFYISIPSLDINRLPVTANVNSTSEDVYNSVLSNSLAHFENTGLPLSDVENNIVIYGHSATTNYHPKTTDPEVAFSFLPNLKVGDEIIIEIEGQEYKYRMYKSKIVEPTDVSIITGKPGKRELTLFTCYPAGNNASRYVAVARPID